MSASLLGARSVDALRVSPSEWAASVAPIGVVSSGTEMSGVGLLPAAVIRLYRLPKETRPVPLGGPAYRVLIARLQLVFRIRRSVCPVWGVLEVDARLAGEQRPFPHDGHLRAEGLPDPGSLGWIEPSSSSGCRLPNIMSPRRSACLSSGDRERSRARDKAGSVVLSVPLSLPRALGASAIRSFVSDGIGHLARVI